MKNWKNRAQKLLIIQNWTFFHVQAWLPKRPIFDRNRNLKGSPYVSPLYILLEQNRKLIFSKKKVLGVLQKTKSLNFFFQQTLLTCAFCKANNREKHSFSSFAVILHRNVQHYSTSIFHNPLWNANVFTIFGWFIIVAIFSSILVTRNLDQNQSAIKVN